MLRQPSLDGERQLLQRSPITSSPTIAMQVRRSHIESDREAHELELRLQAGNPGQLARTRIDREESKMAML
jgi:hypothetical protein